MARGGIDARMTGYWEVRRMIMVMVVLVGASFRNTLLRA